MLVQEVDLFMNQLMNLLKQKFFVIAGPCVIENAELTINIAQNLKKISNDLDIPIIFKASFDKANRSSINAYRGPGVKEGLSILQEIKSLTGLFIITDIHLPEQAELVKDIVDIIQIPALLSRQTDLIVEAAKTQKIINIKKGQFMAPWDILNVLDKIYAESNSQVMVTERGSTFGYNNLIVDMTGMLWMKENLGVPIIFDATHSIQKPGEKGSGSGGRPEYIQGMAKAASALGVNGLFFEVHPTPAKALSDAACSLRLDKLPNILNIVKKITLI